MTLPTAWQTLNVPRTLKRTTRSNSSGAISSAENLALVPATFTRTSILPKSAMTVSTMACTDAGLVTSQATARPLLPSASIASTTGARCDSSRLVTTTSAPPPAMRDRDRLAQPAAAAGDDDHLSCQIEHLDLLPPEGDQVAPTISLCRGTA